jgi:hypothetical protein
MGFIPSSSTIQLYAYFTQYAREKIANSSKNDVRVTQFSLHDDDVNYLLTKEIVNGGYNKLPSGFIPDLTGDIDTCIKSLAFGINKDFSNINLITGTSIQYVPSSGPPSPPPPPSTVRTLTVGFDNANYRSPDAVVGKNGSGTFYINLKQLIGDSNNPTAAEIDATQINITIESFSSDYIEEPIITPASPVSFNSTIEGAGSKFFTFNFGKKPLPPQSQLTTIVFRLTPLSPNRVIETGKETLTYTQEIVWS